MTIFDGRIESCLLFKLTITLQNVFFENAYPNNNDIKTTAV